MKSFKDYLYSMGLREDVGSNIVPDELLEKLITFGSQAYPKFGNVVIMAGGAGSGKGFTLTNLLGIEGKVFDVDKLKVMALKAPHIIKKIKSTTGIDISSFDLKKPDNVVRLHHLLDGLVNKNERPAFIDIMTRAPERKPNLIFDVTLKDINKLRDISNTVIDLGYNKENIHIVWVLNELDVALKQNKERARVLPDDILIQTHEGVSITMHKFLKDASLLRKFMDGDFYISFNKVGVDTDINRSDFGGGFVDKSFYIKIKKTNQDPLSLDDLSKTIIGDKDVLTKIRSYTPKIQSW